MLRDTLAWKKDRAFDRAQRLSTVFERRGQKKEAEEWKGWRLGNLQPIYEPIACLMKPYPQGTTITDNVLKYGVGAMNFDACQVHGSNPSNVLEYGFQPGEERIHEAQKPLALMEFLITLTTNIGQTVLDPFMGSGTTAVAARNLGRHFVGFESNKGFHNASQTRLAENTKQHYLW